MGDQAKSQLLAKSKSSNLRHAYIFLKHLQKAIKKFDFPHTASPYYRYKLLMNYLCKKTTCKCINYIGVTAIFSCGVNTAFSNMKILV